MRLDEYLDDVVGLDAEFTADCFGGDRRVTVRVDGETPGSVKLIIDAPENLFAERLRSAQITAFRHPEYSDELLDASGFQAVHTAVVDLLNSATEQDYHPDDVTYEQGHLWSDGLQITVQVGSRQGETLGAWADRTGRSAAEVLATGFPGNIVSRMHP